MRQGRGPRSCLGRLVGPALYRSVGSAQGSERRIQFYCTSSAALASMPSPSLEGSTNRLRTDHRNLFDRIGKSLGVLEFSDWYSASYLQVLKRGGGKLLKRYHNLEGALRAVYPEFEWQSSKFAEYGRAPRGYLADVNHQREVLNRIANALGVRQPSDWYRYTKSDVKREGGSGLFAYYPSLEQALKAVYPEHPWEVAKFSEGQKKNRLADINYQREMLEQICQELGIKELSDWYGISRGEVISKGGSGLFAYHSNLYQALKAAYPEYPWLASRFSESGRAPKGYLADLATQRELLDRIGLELGVKELSNWYSIPKAEIAKKGGTALLKYYSSIVEALQAVYPEYSWDVSRFEVGALPSIKRSQLGDVHNQRVLLERVAKRLGLKELSDWYNVSKSEVKRCGGGGLLEGHYDTLSQAVQSIYPDHPWDPTKFLEATRRPLGYGSDVNNQRTIINEIGEKLGVKELSDWYSIARQQVIDNGGSILFGHYSSLEGALRSIYPEFSWDAEKFVEGTGRVRPGFWKDKENIIQALHKAEKNLNIEKAEDWYSVTLADLKAIGFGAIINKPRLAELLEEMYPNYEWQKLYLLRGRYAQQKQFEKAVASLFPGVEMKINARKEAQLIHPESGLYLELDIYMPSLNLAFEFQEKHHFTGVGSTFQPVEIQQERDRTKKELATAKGITLIPVPFWWDGRQESLVATIKARRPDLLPDTEVTSEPIPEEMPAGLMNSDSKNQVDGIGEPITATFLTASMVDPTNWWLFEKYDGLRGFWNPEKKAFYSRLGRPFTFPDEIIKAMPQDLFLDGELWFGRDNFQESVKISNRVEVNAIDWAKFKYMVYDLPTHKGPYRARYAALVEYFVNNPCAYVEVAPHAVCTDMTHLEGYLQDVIDAGGEGIILRDPLAAYEPGRSRGYLKHKKFRDAEARVIDRVGAHQWECELPNGVRFVAAPGTTEFAKRWNPKSGDIVSFKHHGFLLESKRPKLPTIYRIRTDLTWDSVISNWKEQKASVNVSPLVKPKPRAMPKGYWMNPKHREEFFIDFAKQRGFDFNDAASWRKITNVQIRSKTGGAGLLSRYGDSLKRALRDTFAHMAE